MKKYAILIAVEAYLDPAIETVPHAQHDAEEFAIVLERHGFDQADQVLLTNSQATKEVITTKVRAVIQQLTPGDTCYLYYAGHGFSSGSQNYLSCHDTIDANRESTSVALEPLFDELQAAQGERVVFFLDCRRGKGPTTIDERSLKRSLDTARKCRCFVACGDDEDAWPSNKLHHGIWTYHLVEAFRGDAPLALERGILTANSLQSYLQREVPRTLLQTYSTAKEQTPWMYGATRSDVDLADLRDLLEERRAQADSSVNLLTGMSFTMVDAEGLKSLSGWKTGNRIPDRYSGSAQAFVASCAADELKGDLDTAYSKLKRAFGFTRRELQAADPEDGTGTIITPHFNYSVTVALNPDELDEVLWTRTVDSIKTPAQVASPAFAEVFDGVFDTLEFLLPKAVIIEDFIDAVEAAKIPGVKLDYDREATYCELRLAGTVGTITLRAGSLSIVHDLPAATQQLLASFETVRKLVQKHQVPLL